MQAAGSSNPSTVLIERSSDASMLREHRRHCSVHDFHTAFVVATIAATARPVPYLESFAAESSGRAVFWFDGEADATRVVADSAVFAPEELRVATAANMAPGDSVIVGRLVMPPAMPLLKMVELLITADVILTYAHIGSTLTVEQRSTSADGCETFAVKGSHEYYTNERNVDELAFEVQVHADGMVVVLSTRS